MLRIALPNKGRLVEDIRELLADAGLPVRSAGDRALVASLGGEFEAIFVRAQDIPEFVADGAADAGITGHDLIRESDRPVLELLDLELGPCRLVVASREEGGVRRVDDVAAGARVATAFPRLTQRFFEDRGRTVTLVPVSGAAEITPHLGVADLIVDLTSTGSTLRVNHLREIETVLTSTARLVTAKDGAAMRDEDKRSALDGLTMALASVLRARGQRYLMANVPRAQLDRVKQVLPGLTGPTVIDILNGGAFVAVHAVVAQQTVYRTIADLKALGGAGILGPRSERLLP